MSTTAKEIAKELGISQATLSLVINNKAGISQRTRDRVLRLMQEKGYDGFLRDKSGNQTKNNDTIGFVIYRRGGELLGFNSFFPLIIDGIESHARKHGYNLNYINISYENLKNEVNYIKEANCVGFVIFATEMKAEDTSEFLKLGIPFVLLDIYFMDQPINAVKVNNEQSIHMAMKYLYDKGHREIGFLKSGVGISSFCERHKYAREAAEALGLANMSQYTFNIGYPSENAYEGMKKLLEENVKLPTAFLADNDLVSVGAMKAFKEKGFRIPEDISFIGFDDRPICTLVEPPLSTIQLSREHFGSEAMELLIRVLHDQSDLPLKVEVSGKLIERGSVKCINAAE